MRSKNRAGVTATSYHPGREGSLHDAVVLVREPFVIDRAVALQAIRYTKELFAGSFSPAEALLSVASDSSVPTTSSSRRRNGSSR
jgi:hypothetical protein